MKKIINIIIIVLIFGALAITNNKINKLENQTKNNEVLEVATIKEVKKDFKIVDTYVTDSGNTVIEFNDQSAAVINQDKNTFEFYPIEKTSNQENLINVIKTYMNNKYDMSYQEIDNHNIFKNANLIVQEVKEVKKIKENKKVVINKNNNDNLKNEPVEIPTEPTEQEEQKQNNYNEDDYNKYLEYKNELIEEYGEEIYNLMNQEAGIETEEDSFNHFMEYGI